MQAKCLTILFYLLCRRKDYIVNILLFNISQSAGKHILIYLCFFMFPLWWDTTLLNNPEGETARAMSSSSNYFSLLELKNRTVLHNIEFCIQNMCVHTLIMLICLEVGSILYWVWLSFPFEWHFVLTWFSLLLVGLVQEYIVMCVVIEMENI